MAARRSYITLRVFRAEDPGRGKKRERERWTVNDAKTALRNLCAGIDVYVEA